MIDWSATGSMLTGIGTIGSGLAIVVAAFLGRKAAGDFRRQKQAEREMEHAERALAAAYRLQSAISAIRNPMSTGTELAESRSELEETDWFNGLDNAKKDRMVQTNVFYQRIRHFKSDFEAALEIVPFVKAFFGNSAADALRDIIKSRHSVRVYADAYGEDTGADPAFSETIRSFIWEGMAGDEADPIESKVSAGIAALEEKMLPAIRAQSTEKTKQMAKAK